VRWSWRRAGATFAVVFWLIPFFLAVSASILAGGCEPFYSQEDCSTAEGGASDVSALLSLFMAFVSAPLTALVAFWWLIRLLVFRLRPPGDGSTDNAGLRESYVWGFAIFLWWFIVFGAVGAILTGEPAWFWMAIIPGIPGVPLAVILLFDWFVRRRLRREEGGAPAR
jgi:hypothetical protein